MIPPRAGLCQPENETYRFVYDGVQDEVRIGNWPFLYFTNITNLNLYTTNSSVVFPSLTDVLVWQWRVYS
jgi:hypothetical protein